ncbi:MAG: ABC transporter ATP-binding protein [Burkholderiaceae bacterium]|jgi:ABC-type Fe3+/spermidine/putrescine transport system ATPase subunit
MVHIEGLKKAFGPTVVLNGVSLTLHAGELVTLLGPSGCGKTTLLRAIAGFDQPDAGDIRVRGESVLHRPPHQRNVGMVFQSYAVFPHLSVADNVGYGLKARHVPAPQRAQRITRALERVKLESFAQRMPSQLSGGQKQRVGLARAIVIEPELLLMDEPLSNLDAKLRIEMRDEIRMLQTELGMTTLYVTHDQEEALAVSDRIAVMQGGHILQIAAPEVLYDEPAHAFVMDFVGGCQWVAHAAGHRTGLRADDLQISSRSDWPGWDHLVIAHRSFLGPRQRLLVKGEGVSLVMDLSAQERLPSVGGQVSVRYDPLRARHFHPETGWRLQSAG